ncbi:MAG: RluA family pseudouridine synthase [Syntrophobacterales bacterium]|nr:RluA family pseudouridine synthase [Syntrophobacterales bacterium]
MENLFARNTLGLLQTRFSWEISPKEANYLLQDFISQALSVRPEIAKDIVEFGCVHVDNLRVKDPSFRLKEVKRIDLYLPSYGVKRFYELDPRRIIYRDQWIIAYNKEPSIPSHQVPYDDYNHVLSALRRFLSKESKNPYVAIHNRLDLEVSGILLFSIDRVVNAKLSKMFAKRRVRKVYILWASGNPPGEKWTCQRAITKKKGIYCCLDEHESGGKFSETKFTLLRSHGSKLLLMAEPTTGRTHQIRLHTLASGLRLYGDKLYGGPAAPRLMLHGWRMEFRHPITGQKVFLEAPIPEEFFSNSNMFD